MSHLCEQLVEAARYLESEGLSQEQLSALHHFSQKGRRIAFDSIHRYFSVNKDLRQNNTNFAYRVIFVAREHRSGDQSMNVLIQRALSNWPL